MQTEYEIKFYDIDIQNIRTKLKQNEFVCVQEMTLMKRVVFDNPIKEKSYFRIRDEGKKITCTYKEISSISSIEQVKEIEIVVDDFQKLYDIFLSIGHNPKALQKSKREKTFARGLNRMLYRYMALTETIYGNGIKHRRTSKVSI